MDIHFFWSVGLCLILVIYRKTQNLQPRAFETLGPRVCVCVCVCACVYMYICFQSTKPSLTYSGPDDGKNTHNLVMLMSFANTRFTHYPKI